mgnify:CR=1 FL=1
MMVLRDLSVILLAAEAFLFALISLALFGAMVYGVWRLRRHRNLPSWLSTGRGYVMLALSYVERAMELVAQPVIAAHSTSAKVTGWIRAVRKHRG